MSGKAQGALEYLLLVGGVILVAALVIAVVTNVVSNVSGVAGYRIGEALCATFTQAECGFRDPDKEGPLTEAHCIWSAETKKCIANPSPVIKLKASDGKVKSHKKISSTQGDFTGELDDQDLFGSAVARLGDLDGDGVTDIAVGAREDDDGGGAAGAVWILFLKSDGKVKSHQKISSTQGGFTGALDNDDRFGGALASLGDLDGDGVTDIAVGAQEDDDGGQDRGAIWILFLNTDGKVKSHKKISSTQGGFTGALDNGDRFGSSVANLGKFDGDSVIDIVVGAPLDDDGGDNQGAVWILFLNSDGKVKSHKKISDTEGGFAGVPDHFGDSVSKIKDLDGDGVTDIVAGATDVDDGGSNRGAVWVLLLKSDGTVKSHQKISSTSGGFTGALDNTDFFGVSVVDLDDLDGDGVTDIAVGARGDDDGGEDRGALWVLFLNTSGKVKSHQKISSTEGNFTGTLNNGDGFGYSVTVLMDFSGDNVMDIVVGADRDNDGSRDRGAVWLLFLKEK